MFPASRCPGHLPTTHVYHSFDNETDAPGAHPSSQEAQREGQIQPLVVAATCRVLTASCRELSLRWESAAVMERMALQKAASACFLGDQQDPPTAAPQRVRKEKARMEDGALETVRKPRGHASLIYTLTLLRVKAVVSLLGRKRCFSLTMNSFTINSHGSMQQPHPSPHTIIFPFPYESHMMTCGVSGASNSCSRRVQ